MGGLSRRSKESIFSVLPAGIVMPFAGSVAPTGWAFCDGTTIDRNTYSELFIALGTSHGIGDGATTFHLPDYRGRFMRGTSAGTGRDPNAGTRASSNSGGNTGDNVGSVQGQATRKNGLSNAQSGGISAGHTHRQVGTNNFGGNVGYHNVTNAGGVLQLTSIMNTGGQSSNHTHAVGMNVGDSETRALNANVNYIIKL